MEANAAENRALRAAALDRGLNPDDFPPEDLLLLGKDEKGALIACREYEAAAKRAAHYAELEALRHGR